MKHISISLLFAAAILFALGCSQQADRAQDDHAHSKEHAHDDHAGHDHAEDDHAGHDHGEPTAQDDHGDDHGHGEGGVVETLWQDNIEMFGEWPPFVAGQSSEAVLHFTSLVTFQPATQVPLMIEWLSGGRVIKSQVQESVTRTGIFVVDIMPPDPGTYELSMSLATSEMSGTVRLQNVQVYSGHAPDMQEEESSEPEISFLKEQQWVLGTKTGVVERRDLHDNLRSPGELKPAGSKSSEVFAPFAGVLQPDHNFGAVRHGQTVRKGQALAMIAPSPNSENSWIRLIGEYRLAKAEQERVQRLYDQQAVPVKRYEEATQQLALKKAQLSSALGDSELEDIDSETPHFTLRSPRNGVIVQHDAAYGALVQAGDRLFSVIDPDLVWLEVNVPAADIRDLSEVKRAYFRVGGADHVYSTDDFGANVIASGSVLDPETRRIPITFELKNPDGLLKVGEFVQVEVQTSNARNVLAVPKSAVLEDGGAAVAYVQKGGESWVRRVVTTGTIDGPWVEIVSGLNEGERIATEGAYKIKLASGSVGEVGHGHAH
jgi:cobalt-zinc-cadmium efflux system membrane fusion protein